MGLRPLVELCVEPAGVSRRCTGVSLLLLWCLPPQGCLQRGVRASGSFQERTGKSGSFVVIKIFWWKWKSLSHVWLFVSPWNSPWNFPGQSTRVGTLSLLQVIFLIQELNEGLLQCRWILYQLSYQGSLGSMLLDKKWKYRQMEQDRKPRNKPMYLWVPHFLRRSKEYTIGQRQPLQ